MRRKHLGVGPRDSLGISRQRGGISWLVYQSYPARDSDIAQPCPYYQCEAWSLGCLKYTKPSGAHIG